MASINGRHTDVTIVDDVLPVPHKLEGMAETSNPSVHMTKRSVITVRLLSSQSSGSGSFAGLVGAGPGFGPQPPAIVHPDRLQSSGGQGGHPDPRQYPP